MLADTSTESRGVKKLELYSSGSQHAQERGIDNPMRNDAPNFTLARCVDWDAHKTLGRSTELGYGADICDARYRFEKWASEVPGHVTSCAIVPTLTRTEADLEAQKDGFTIDLNINCYSPPECTPYSGLLLTLQARSPATSDHLESSISEQHRANINFCQQNTIDALLGVSFAELTNCTCPEQFHSMPLFYTPGYTTLKTRASQLHTNQATSNDLLIDPP
jgi:hypothetical protein